MSKTQVVVIFPTYKEYNQKYVALGHVNVFKGPFKALKKTCSNGFLNGIGGHVKQEKKETPLTAALRELKEEVTISGIEKLPASKLIEIGKVDITFMPEGRQVELFVFRMYFPERVLITPNGNDEFASFDWYPIRNITTHGIGPNGSSILPADRFWLPHFLVGKGHHTAEIEVDKNLCIYQTGEGEDFRSGKVIIYAATPLEEDLPKPPT